MPEPTIVITTHFQHRWESRIKSDYSLAMAMLGSMCPEKGGSHKASEEPDSLFDSYYCVKCGKWLEPRCCDPECNFCADRPDKNMIELWRANESLQV